MFQKKFLATFDALFLLLAGLFLLYHSHFLLSIKSKYYRKCKKEYISDKETNEKKGKQNG